MLPGGNPASPSPPPCQASSRILALYAHLLLHGTHLLLQNNVLRLPLELGGMVPPLNQAADDADKDNRGAGVLLVGRQAAEDHGCPDQVEEELCGRARVDDPRRARLEGPQPEELTQGDEDDTVCSRRLRDALVMCLARGAGEVSHQSWHLHQTIMPQS
jgi:hypothetical protein